MTGIRMNHWDSAVATVITQTKHVAGVQDVGLGIDAAAQGVVEEERRRIAKMFQGVGGGG